MTARDTGPAPLTEATFTAEHTRVVLDTACRSTGLDGTDAILLRHHTNAVYRLTTTPIVVKIGRPSRHQPIDIVGLVRWLQHESIPTVALAPIEQPLTLAGCPITFWRYLDQHDSLISASDLAEPLAVLHSRSTTPPIRLPDQHIRTTLDKIAAAIDTSPILTAEDRTLLHSRRTELATQALHVRYMMAPSVIHGDAHHANTLRATDTTRAVLGDWDSAALGPPEWDLVTLEVHSRRFRYPAGEYDAFCRAYGHDIRDWEHYPWLRDLRELRMITTNARKSPPGSTAATEVRRRINALHTNTTISWNIL